MRLEHLPLILGILVGIVGLGLFLDGWIADDTVIPKERRRQARVERDRGGEMLLGLGTLALAAALLGRDQWRYGTVSVMAGTALVVIGAWRNRAYLRQWMLNRGAERRGLPPARTRSGETRIR